MRAKFLGLLFVLVWSPFSFGQPSSHEDSIIKGLPALELYNYLHDQMGIKSRPHDSENKEEVRLLGMECVRNLDIDKEDSVSCHFDKLSDPEELYKVKTILKAYNFREDHPIFDLTEDQVF